MNKGRSIIIRLNNQAIAACKSNDIESGSDVIEVSSPTSGQFKEFIPGRKEWSFSSSQMITYLPAALLKVGTVYNVTISSPKLLESDAFTTTLHSGTMRGSAILKGASVNAECGHLARGSWKFVGSGQLTEVDPVVLTDNSSFTFKGTKLPPASYSTSAGGILSAPLSDFKDSYIDPNHIRVELTFDPHVINSSTELNIIVDEVMFGDQKMNRSGGNWTISTEAGLLPFFIVSVKYHIEGAEGFATSQCTLRLQK